MDYHKMVQPGQQLRYRGGDIYNLSRGHWTALIDASWDVSGKAGMGSVVYDDTGQVQLVLAYTASLNDAF
jgi:hypothetical protein